MASLLFFHPAVCKDDDLVSGLGQTGGGTVDANHPGAGGAFYGVGFEAVTCVDVDDLNLLTRQDIGGAQQIAVDGDAADIVQVGFGYGCSVDFAF